jgi:hypothetical protein
VKSFNRCISCSSLSFSCPSCTETLQSCVAAPRVVVQEPGVSCDQICPIHLMQKHNFFKGITAEMKSIEGSHRRLASMHIIVDRKAYAVPRAGCAEYHMTS